MQLTAESSLTISTEHRYLQPGVDLLFTRAPVLRLITDRGTCRLRAGGYRTEENKRQNVKLRLDARELPCRNGSRTEGAGAAGREVRILFAYRFSFNRNLDRTMEQDFSFFVSESGPFLSQNSDLF